METLISAERLAAAGLTFGPLISENLSAIVPGGDSDRVPLEPKAAVAMASGASPHRGTQGRVRWSVACLAILVLMISLGSALFPRWHARPSEGEIQNEAPVTPSETPPHELVPPEAKTREDIPIIPSSSPVASRRRPAPRMTRAQAVPATAPRPACSAPATVELTGVIGILGRPRALLEITEPGVGRMVRKVTVQEGDHVDSVEVVQIDATKGRVKIRNSGTESVLSLKRPQPGVVAADVQAGRTWGSSSSMAANWPGYSGELHGDLELRVKNPNEFGVRVGLRSEGKGKDFYVPAHGAQTVLVPSGHYVPHFQFSNDPQGLYQGDSFFLILRGADMTITKVANGNYGIRRVN